MVGMTVLDTGSEVADEMDTLEQHYADYDFIFFHVKKTDSAGEDGDFDKKAHIIEELEYSKQLYRKIPSLRVIDVTDRSIEEISEWITRQVL